jgi:hypothetical protein
MLIRKPVVDVFEDLVNPDITTKSWSTESSGRLEAGKQVNGIGKCTAFSIPVTAQADEQNKRIVIEWLRHSGLTTVDGYPHLKRVAQRSSVSRRPASLVTR